MSNRRRAASLVAIAFAMAACSGGSASSESTGRQAITVFAAASLTDAFDEIANGFSRATGSVDVEFNFLASSDLAAQIIEGAPADVFASADEASLARVIDEGLAAEPVVFAENRLSIAVPTGNPGDVESLDDLEDPDLVVALCNEDCPAGRYAMEVFERAGVAVEPDSLEADVRGVLTRVGLGEADAGIVYVTDIAADPDVEGVDIPDEINIVATYPIATLEGAADEASEFIGYVRSEPGKRILTDYGFGLP
jgi:molybdate transport system substrate-binding protein